MAAGAFLLIMILLLCFRRRKVHRANLVYAFVLFHIYSHPIPSSLPFILEGARDGRTR